MDSVAYVADDDQPEQTVSAFLMLVLEFAAQVGLFDLLSSLLEVEMKEVVYTLLNKAQTVIASIVVGCAYTKDINERLGREPVAAAYLGMERFPDQSQLNRYLRRFTPTNIEQLAWVHERCFVAQSRARQAAGWVVVDFDQMGLVANGKSFEFSRKGYFPRKRGQQGYQVSAAYIGAYEEALAIFLDPGNVHCAERFDDPLRALDRALGADNPRVKLIRRFDAGYDSAERRGQLQEMDGYFIIKSCQTRMADRLAAQEPFSSWLSVAANVHGVELTPEGGLRRLLYELVTGEGQLLHQLLYTNLPTYAFGLARCFQFYNERQTMEAFFRQSRHVYGMKNLRSRRFNAIYAFLRFIFLAHNLIHWAKQAHFAGTELVKATTRELVQQVAQVRARVQKLGRQVRLLLPTNSRWGQMLMEALCPSTRQLELPFARLHKI